MGATSTNRPKGVTTEDFFKAEFPTTLTATGEILASAVVKTGEKASWGGWPEVFYAAVKGSSVHGPEHVWALVVPFVRSSGYYNITYKEMDETVGPCEASCPAKILDLLSPTDSEWANEWRARCRAHAAGLARVKALKAGDTVVLAKPVEFSDGRKIARLTLADAKAGRWSAGAYYRLPLADLAGRDFTVLRSEV